MQVIHDPLSLRAGIKAGERVAFVPTMGNLHEGHLHLVQQARKYADRVVVSIFVNPLQFGPNEDFARYPRTLEADCDRLAEAGADLVFAPAVDTMYPVPQQIFVEPPPLAEQLCGAFRPGHFRGVATVVAKLFNLVQPQVALFGKKDYQQLAVIRALVQQLNFPIEIVGVDTVRAADGLALSSRNGYLDAQQRAEAPRLYRSLQQICRALEQGERDFERLQQQAIDDLQAHGWKVDYVSVREQSGLRVPAAEDSRLVVLGAAWLGATRLIDNLESST